MGGVIGAYTGFSFANNKEKRILTIQFLREALSEDFPRKRVSVWDTLDVEEPDLAGIAEADTEEMRKLRLHLVEIFNSYDLICELFMSKDLDKTLFDKHLRKMIRDDYTLVDGILRAIEVRQLHTKGELRRPFFPSVGQVVGR